MKVNLKKIDTGRIVELLTTHVEKIVFGVFVFAFLLFCYGAISQKPYDKAPDRFKTKSDEVNQAVQAARFDPATDVPPAPKPAEEKEIAAQVWITREPFVQPVFDFGKRRPEPRLLAARDLRVASGYGAVATIPTEATGAPRDGGKAPLQAPSPGKTGGMRMNVAAPPAPAKSGGKMNMMQNVKAAGANKAGFGETDDARPPRGFEQPTADYNVSGEPQGKQWVVVTALVPLQEQIKEYRAAFQGTSRSYQGDQQPVYVSYEAERAEISPGTPDDAKLEWSPIDLKSIAADEATYSGKVPDLIDPIYYAGEACRPLPPLMGRVHDKTVVHPKIPLAATTDAAAAPVNAGFPAAAGARPGGLPMAAPAAQGPGGGLGRVMRMGGGFGKAQPAMPEGNFAQPGAPAPKIEYQMFRFFDFTVRPGKSYRYRVRLLVANPNHGIPARYLAAPALAKGETRPTAWSDPSPAIAAPRGSSLLAGGVEPQRGLNEQKAEVLVRAWNSGQAVDAARISKLVRGQVANFNDKVPIERPNTKAVTTEQIKFETDSLLVDMAGGDGFSAAVRAPGQMLVLEPNGELTVRSELAEAESYGPAVKHVKDITDLSKPPAGAGADDRPTRDGPTINSLQPPPGKSRGLPTAK
ncbi:MAG: hypothetical protein HYX69_01535 [Planctomycetia bacterium]|nr:hypothetical protein [Planctomycetia bacterium]